MREKICGFQLLASNIKQSKKGVDNERIQCLRMLIIKTNCTKRDEDEETDKPLEKVLIPNKYTRESFQIWCARLSSTYREVGNIMRTLIPVVWN